ncbi:MAG: hypothetical protein JJU22_11720, partial [Gammaproteobacteria bacterium]|nr:hypothetical protein [Gammaproteobacteria bacterium]
MTGITFLGRAAGSGRGKYQRKAAACSFQAHRPQRRCVRSWQRPLWESPNRKAIGPISMRSAEADVVAGAERIPHRRISLREIALSHTAALPPCGKALIAKRLGRSRNALPKPMSLPALNASQFGA